MVIALTTALALSLPSGALADEPYVLSGEAELALPLSEPQSERFGPGGSLAVGLLRPFGSIVGLGVRLRGAVLLDGDAPADSSLEDPGMGTLLALHLLLRFRVPVGEPVGRMDGLHFEIGGGAGLTGDQLRPTLELGAGYLFDAGPITFGPVLRYLQVVELDQPLDARDARLAMIGLEATLFDLEPPPPAPPAPPPDRDRDGVFDSRDGCPANAEDTDDFEDEDGCPDDDNDRDGIADRDDGCPLEPEDGDGFEDEDGCPEADNDHDGFLDADDQCPNEPEVVNGVDDHDGCKDEGLIEMVDDRIVLEERVLFDFERSRVKSRARPVLEAIVSLYRQHPEWSEIVIEGHADARGDSDFNQSLSERRARNVMRALVRLGIPKDIIRHVGHGANHLRDPGTTEEAHQRNRRVEFVVVARRTGDSEPQDEEPAEPAQGGDGGGDNDEAPQP